MSLRYLKQELIYKVGILHAEKHEGLFKKLILLFLMGLAKHGQSTPDKFSVSFWHLKKEVRNEVRDLTDWFK